MGHLERPDTETPATLSVRIFPQYFNDSSLAMDGDFRRATRSHPDSLAAAWPPDIYRDTPGTAGVVDTVTGSRDTVSF